MMDRGDGEPFILHAGDDVVVSEGAGHLRRLKDAFEGHGADIAFLLEDVDDPSQYGVAEGLDMGGGVIGVRAVHEKPARPPSRHAIVAVYMLGPSIFGYLDAAAGAPPAVRLAEAFRLAIKDGRRAVGVLLGDGEYRMDVGTHGSYSACSRPCHRRACPDSILPPACWSYRPRLAVPLASRPRRRRHGAVKAHPEVNVVVA